MAKTLGPTANRGLGFWAQQSIVRGLEIDDTIEVRAPHFSPVWQYPLPGATAYGININLFPPPEPPPPVDTTHELRTPYFSPPRPYPLPAPTWTWGFQGFITVTVTTEPIGVELYDVPPIAVRQPIQSWIFPTNAVLKIASPPADEILFGQALL
jgi:hypothetical protein